MEHPHPKRAYITKPGKYQSLNLASNHSLPKYLSPDIQCDRVSLRAQRFSLIISFRYLGAEGRNCHGNIWSTTQPSRSQEQES